MSEHPSHAFPRNMDTLSPICEVFSGPCPFRNKVIYLLRHFFCLPLQFFSWRAQKQIGYEKQIAHKRRLVLGELNRVISSFFLVAFSTPERAPSRFLRVVISHFCSLRVSAHNEPHFSSKSLHPALIKRRLSSRSNERGEEKDSGNYANAAHCRGLGRQAASPRLPDCAPTPSTLAQSKERKGECRVGE